MEYIFASDPHGTGQAWIDLVNQAKEKYPSSTLIFGGDYIDGRDQCLETVNFVNEQETQGAKVLFGNHEDMMVNFVEYDDDLWLFNGGRTTIRSLLGNDFDRQQARRRLAENEYYLWIKNHYNSLIFETERMVFVHAGINTNNQPVNRNYKLWARQEYWYGDAKKERSNEIFAHNQTEKVIITGHTPTCLLKGVLEDPVPEGQFEIIGYADIDYSCPVVKVQYLHEEARYFTDGGCHGQWPGHHGNVCVFDNGGELIDVYN